MRSHSPRSRFLGIMMMIMMSSSALPFRGISHDERPTADRQPFRSEHFLRLNCQANSYFAALAPAHRRHFVLLSGYRCGTCGDRLAVFRPRTDFIHTDPLTIHQQTSNSTNQNSPFWPGDLQRCLRLHVEETWEPAFFRPAESLPAPNGAFSRHMAAVILSIPREVLLGI